jgi:hypothetical protein
MPQRLRAIHIKPWFACARDDARPRRTSPFRRGFWRSLTPTDLCADYVHRYDIIITAYNSTDLGPWCSQFCARLPARNSAGHCPFIADPADWTLYDAGDAVMNRFPARAFAITTLRRRHCRPLHRHA